MACGFWCIISSARALFTQPCVHNISSPNHPSSSTTSHQSLLSFSPLTMTCHVLQILVKEVSKPWYHFLTTTCAIVGGVFTMAGILDAILYTSLKMVKKVGAEMRHLASWCCSAQASWCIWGKGTHMCRCGRLSRGKIVCKIAKKAGRLGSLLYWCCC